MTDRTFRFLLSRVQPEYRFTLIDIGAMGGIPKKWKAIERDIQVIGFEPDEREFQSLRTNGRTTYLNSMLYGEPTELKFYITKAPGKSSLYAPNRELLSEFADAERFEVEKVEVIPQGKVKKLDSVILDQSHHDIDFIKLDTQGSELPILEGCQELVIAKTFGMQIEVEFIQMYRDQSLFRDVDRFMGEHGFELMDLRRQYWKRKDYYDYVGKGQLVFGDALYFKRFDRFFDHLRAFRDESYSLSKIYKSILTCLIYGMLDYAVAMAKQAFERKYFSEVEYESLVSRLRTRSNGTVIPSFPGRRFLYKVVNKLHGLLRPKSYLGWSDSDREIGNIKDD